MPTLTAGAVAIAVAQIASVLVLGAVLYGCYLQYRKPYLLHWTYGWAALICFQVATQANFFLALQLDLPPVHPLRLLAGTVGGVAGFLNIAWLFFGVYELARRRPVRLAQQKGILIAAGVFGVAMAMLVLIPEIRPEYRYAIRVSTRGVVGAIVFAYAGQALWRERRRREGVGFTILSLAFFAYAAELLHYATLGVAWMVSGSIASYTTYIGYLDLVLLALMSVGMVASLLEDEREAADLAAQQVEHLAYHDALTGLPNRPLFGDRLIMALAQAHRMQQKLAVLFLDLDRFKDINDSLGHSVGDVLLKAVAARIRGCIREGDTVARFGGDEFTLLIPRIDHVEDAAKIAQKIIEMLKIPFDVHERELFVTTSIGVSIYPTDGEDADTLVRNADTAMYRAKDQGRDNYQLYAPAMNARALEQLSLENTLRRAVTQNELVLHYQPVIDLKTLRVVALEALVRWNHPEMGLLLPAHFISVAERSGVIVPLGEWVLQNACSQIRAWKRLNPVIVSVNLSARQFQQPDLVQMIRRAIEHHRIDPQLLQIEITESNAMQHADNTMHILRELKSLGIRIAMDDFGTGYSSLSYLKRFPIDTLKLDASFVQDIATEETDAAIVCAVIAMAHSLRIDVVAEGVETGDQLDVLARNGCDLIQGYLFSRPLPADQVEAYLTSEIRANGSPAMPIRSGSEAPL